MYSTAVVYILNNVCVPTVVLIDAELEPPAVHMVAERLDAAGEPVRVRDWRIITCACSRDQSVQPLKPVLKCAYRHTGSPVRIHVRPLEPVLMYAYQLVLWNRFSCLHNSEATGTVLMYAH